MKYFYKLIIIFLNLILLIGCATNFYNNTFDSDKVISIEKPKVNYDLKKLPKNINILLFDTKSNKEKEFINGFWVNYFHFKKLINYSPKVNFITSKDLDKTDCSSILKKNNYSIIYLTEDLLKNLETSCLNQILRLKALIINTTNSFKKFNQLQTVLDLDKSKEFENLLKFAKNNGSTNAYFIDEENTLDNDLLSNIWLSLEGNVMGFSTSNNQIDQNLISNALLIESSKERARKLSRALSASLESKPRRRMDLDTIIMSVSLDEARRLKPELEYNFGESLSVYLLPYWENKNFYFEKEYDLESVWLIDLPWMFNPKISYLQDLPKKRSRNFAFGYDSYDLTILLNNPSSLKKFHFIGMSGQLIYENGKLSRKSLKAEINEGQFKSIGY